MSRRISIALLAALLSTSAFAQSAGSGGAGSGGAAGGASGSVPSGTAGVSPSTSNPGIGTPGTPGPSSGAGLPGGPGPGSTAVVPNQPSPPASNPTVGPASGSNIGSAPSPSGGGPRSQASPGAQSRVPPPANTQPSGNFNPEAVTDSALDAAMKDLAAMTASELRSLVQVFDTCTANQHPLERIGKCGAVSRSYKSKYGRGRQIDRSIAELERVVRFQNMFRTTGVRSTEFEDHINNRLRKSARLALATNQLRERQARESGAQPDLTKDVRMAK